MSTAVEPVVAVPPPGSSVPPSGNPLVGDFKKSARPVDRSLTEGRRFGEALPFSSFFFSSASSPLEQRNISKNSLQLWMNEMNVDFFQTDLYLSFK
jgi:hypothetical protein